MFCDIFLISSTSFLKLPEGFITLVLQKAIHQFFSANSSSFSHAFSGDSSMFLGSSSTKVSSLLDIFRVHLSNRLAVSFSSSVSALHLKNCRFEVKILLVSLCTSISAFTANPSFHFLCQSGFLSSLISIFASFCCSCFFFSFFFFSWRRFIFYTKSTKNIYRKKRKKTDISNTVRKHSKRNKSRKIGKP